MSTPEAPTSTTQRAASRFVRVAVVQLAYLPAFQDSQDYLSEPTHHLEGAVSCLLPVGMQAAPQAITQAYIELRRRLRATYVKQLKLRVLEILNACNRWEVKVVVFPEYSIPPEILSDIATAVPAIVVVAGSHFVSDDVIDAGYYEKLGQPRNEDLFQHAVSPVIHGGKILALVKKVHPAKPEVNIIKSSEDWAPVDLPASIPGQMALLICLDFLARGTNEHWQRIAPKLRDCRFIATPALSPKHSLDEFMSVARVDAKRDAHKKPVLLANDAQHGGSTLIVDEGHGENNRLFPEHAGLLEQGEEGVVVADIDLGTRPPGPSTTHQINPNIKPIAAASLVYRGTDHKYAQWVIAAQTILEPRAISDYQKLKSFKAFLQEQRPEIPKTESARQRRLLRLLESAPNIERVKQWTREVVLPEDMLPLSVLRAALARGAADVIEQWEREKNLGAFGPVVQRLREAWDKEKKEAWTTTVHATANAVRGEVAGEAHQRSPQALFAKVSVYEPIVRNHFENAIRDAVEFLQKEDFIEGKQRLERIASDIESKIQGVIEQGGSSDELVQQRARCQMFIGLATLNLQEMAQARAILLGIDPAMLTEKARLQWIAALVLIGEVEPAKNALPAKEDVSNEALPDWAHAKQGIMLAQGVIPETLMPNEGLQLQAANVCLAQNNDEMAARLASDVLRNDNLGAVTQAIATHTLCAALMRTVHDWPVAPEPPATRIPLELALREAIVQQLERSFRDLRGANLPEGMRKQLSNLERGFRVWTKDYDAMAAFAKEALDDFEDDDDSHPNHAERDRAFELVRKGDVDEALRILPADPHPWRRRADEVDLLAHGKRYEQALEKAIALQQDVPDRPRIECALVELYLIAKKLPEALAHADRAFVALPGIGHRLLFVQTRINSGDWNGAFELVQSHLDDERPRVLQAIGATAMMTDRLPIAERALTRYIEKNPNEWAPRLDLAQIQHRLYRLEDAAKTSYDAFVRHGDELTAPALYQCGFFQATGLKAERERIARIKAIAKKMHERFPKDIEVQELRAQLLSKLGEIPADADRIDFDALAKRGTAFRQVKIAAFVEHLKAQNAFLQVTFEAAQKGALPISKTLRLANNDPARFLVTILEHFDEQKWVCPPISLVNEPPAMQFNEATILLGQLELLLLIKLNLFEPLQETLKPNGTLALFPHVKQQILSDAADLRTRARQEKLDFVEAMIRKLESWPEGKPDENIPLVDWPPREHAIPELAIQPPGPFVHIHGYLHLLKRKGVLTTDELAGLEKELGLNGEPDVVLPDPLPERIGFHFMFIEKLERAGLLDKVRREYPKQIVLAPQTLAYFRKERNQRRMELAASELADKAFEIVADERLRVLRVPLTDEVPPLRADLSDNYEELVREPLQEVVAYRNAVLDDPNRWHLTAEYFGSTGLGDPNFVEMLAWPDDDHKKNVAALVRKGAARDITFPSLVRYLMTEPKDADPKLRLLASLGFADALGPAELLRLDKQYLGFDGAEPKRLLQAMEWMARHPQHLGGEYARLRIANTYAKAVFDAYRAQDRSEEESFRVLEQLFGRLERVGDETNTDALDSALIALATDMALESQNAWKPNEEQTSWRLDQNAAFLRLWRAVKSWCEVNFVRRAALGRATRWLWVQLSQENGGPPEFVARALTVMLPERLNEFDVSRALLEPAIEATTILQIFWETNPFAQTKIAKIVEASVTSLRAGKAPSPGGRFHEINIRFTSKSESVSVAIPIEAAFLSLSADEKRSIAERIQIAQGPYDGLAYVLLESIKQNSEDLKVQSEYAQYTTNALFRLVQDDPSYLYRWQQGHWLGDQEIRPLPLILMILSEGPALPEKAPLFDILQQRATQGDWTPEKRVDGFFLLKMASEFPGVFPAFAVVATRLQDEYAESEIAAAIDRVTHPENHPIARVANEAYFLRIAASRRPYLTLSGKKIDLHDELPRYLEGLLESVIADPPANTMAFFEPALLRVCGGVLLRLAFPDPLPLREGIFWMYRLFQWLCLQLEAISPDARLDGMRRLAALAPHVSKPQDILDPIGFGRNDLDIRLATVLHTLAHLHILDFPEGLGASNIANHTPAHVSTAKIEQRLLELAQTSYQGPILGTVFSDWHFPGNVPDMALYTLLQLNNARFADMSEESRLRRFEAIPKNIEAIDNEHEGERLLLDLVLAAALNHAESLTPKERQLVETKIREMDESPQAARYRRGMAVAFFAAGDAHFEGEAFARVLEDPTDRDLGGMLGALFLIVANRDPSSLESVVRNMAKGLAEKGADSVHIIWSSLSHVLNTGKPESREATRALLVRLAKEEPFRNDLRTPELLTTLSISNNPV